MSPNAICTGWFGVAAALYPAPQHNTSPRTTAQALGSSPGLTASGANTPTPNRSAARSGGVGIAPAHLTWLPSTPHAPRGPTANENNSVWSRPGGNAGTSAGVSEHVTLGAATGPARVGNAVRSAGGHAAAVPNRPSRLAPQQWMSPRYAHENVSAAYTPGALGSGNDGGFAPRLHGTTRPATSQVSVDLNPSCPVSLRPQHRTESPATQP